MDIRKSGFHAEALRHLAAGPAFLAAAVNDQRLPGHPRLKHHGQKIIPMILIQQHGPGDVTLVELRS